MNGYKAFVMYVALKAHFTNPKYNYFKNRGQTTANFDSFSKRSDKYYFEKLAEKYPTKERCLGFLVCNLLLDKDFYIGDFRNRLTEKKYKEWVGRLDSLLYIFETDLRKVQNESEQTDTTFRNFFRIKSGHTTSRFLEMTLEGVTTLETYVLVDNLLGLTEYYDGKIIDPLYEDFAFKVKKYSPFIQLDRARFAQLFNKFI